MKFDIGILQMAQDLAAHASSRQSIIAQNIANADTPGYKARDVSSFADSYAAHDRAKASHRPARAGHIALGTSPQTVRVFEAAAFGADSPNGNTVSIEDQMVRSAEVRHQHDLALGVFGKSVDILRAGMGRIR